MSEVCKNRNSYDFIKQNKASKPYIEMARPVDNLECDDLVVDDGGEAVRLLVRVVIAADKSSRYESDHHR